MQTNLKPKAVIWSQQSCPACDAAKKLAQELGLDYEVKMLDSVKTKEVFFEQFPGARSVPQITLDGKWVGGLQEFRQALGEYSTID